ncbi:MAG: mechanosensitive ion channel [Pyrinomonadaceae bacterium]|nr:mechanosensitive ion channel [Pyrinomonadaceae bacterium]
MEQFSELIHYYASLVGPYPWLRSLLIIVVSIFLGKVVDWIITGSVSRLVMKTKSSFDDDILNLLHKPIFLSVLLIGLTFAVYELELQENVTVTTVRVLKTIAVFIWLRFALQASRRTFDELGKSESRLKFITPTTKPLLINTAVLIFAAVSTYIVFLIWSINITAWIASAGIIGLAISFAAKDTLSNIFGGITIFADKPFEVGDFINLESGERGMITHIGVRSTRIITRDDIEITVPNAILSTTIVVNESGGPSEKFRIRIKVGVAYGSDIDKVERILLEIGKGHKETCEIPKPRVRFRNFGDSSLDYELLCWVEKPVFRGRVSHELNREVYKAFDRENIEIPFPQQDIHIKQIPESVKN